MSSNKRTKNKLIEIYGDECFIDKLKLRKTKERYTSKEQYKRMKQLTYHHIVEKRNRWKNNCRKWSVTFRRKPHLV